MRIFVKWLICFAAVYIASLLFPGGVVIYGTGLIIAAAATVLWLVNIFIKPIAQLISIIPSIITLGLFSFIVNAAMVSLTDWIIPGISITSFGICLFIALLISAGNVLVNQSRRTSH